MSGVDFGNTRLCGIVLDFVTERTCFGYEALLLLAHFRDFHVFFPNKNPRKRACGGFGGAVRQRRYRVVRTFRSKSIFRRARWAALLTGAAAGSGIVCSWD
jgi:hypothetical protein